MPCPASNSCARGGAQALSDTTKKNSCSRIRGCSLEGGCPKCALVGGAGFGWYSNQCILTVGSLSGGSDMLWNVADGEIRWGLRQVEMPVLFPVHDWQKMAHRGFSICRCRCAMQKTSKQPEINPLVQLPFFVVADAPLMLVGTFISLPCFLAVGEPLEQVECINPALCAKPRRVR